MKRKFLLLIALFPLFAPHSRGCDVDNPPRLVAFPTAPASLSPDHSIRLWVQNGYLPQIPVLVRVELRNAGGQRDWAIWDIDATLSTDQAGISLSTNRIPLHN